MKAVVVEDLPEVREALIAEIGTCLPEVEIVGAAATVVSAAKEIKRLSPDLLFLDIELPDGTAFDLLDIVGKQRKVIFITGSEAYAIRAFEYAALNYLLKPVSCPALRESLQRLAGESADSTGQVEIVKTVMTNARSDKIAFHTHDRIHIVPVRTLVSLHADGNYTEVRLAEGTGIVVARTLKVYDQLLSGENFIRVHQSHLVNFDYVSEYVRVDGGYLVMKDGRKIPVSTRKRNEVLEYINSMS